MSGGRTMWWSKDVAWWRRDRIVELGEEHGPAGPAVIDWLTCEAKAQGPKRGHDGTVKAGYRGVARGCFVDVDAARQVIEHATRIGLLDDFAEADDRTFTCRISGWDNDIEKPLAAAKKAAQRADQDPADDGGHPGTSDDASPDVPGCPPTEQDRTEQTSSLRSDDARKRARSIRFGGKAVTDAGVELAVAVVEAFNRAAGTSYRPFTDAGKPSENLKRVLGAILGDQRITAEVAERMIQQTLGQADRYWLPKTPHLGHVFSPGVVEGNLEQALRPVGAGAGLSDGDRHALASQHRTALAERQFEREFGGGAQAA